MKSRSNEEKRIVIIGAGPTGLGAGYRLNELGYRNWCIYEKNDYIGGLSASFKDKAGFTWDIGGHVLFSHYPYFDAVVERALEGKYLEHPRKSYIRIQDKWIPYPFQNNIRYLSDDMTYDCLIGLLGKNDIGNMEKTPVNFKEWIFHTFGKGISEYFMYPYNKKVWAHPLEEMNKDWIAERVSIVDFKRVLKNVVYKLDDVSWGPNNKFKFPLYGGTGAIFNGIEKLIESDVMLNYELVSIDINKKEIKFGNGIIDNYDVLITTMPLNKLISIITPKSGDITEAGNKLKFNSGYIVGVGLEGNTPDSKCWMYFPEDNAPFYRVTYFSNYSPNNVPAGKPCYSLMCETSYSYYKKYSKDAIIDETITGLIDTGLIKSSEINKIITTYLIDINFSYPIPTMDLNKNLKIVQKHMMVNSIYSRGRFGGWKYEVGNMDHSFMQGVEVVDRIVTSKEETTYKL